MTVNDLPVDPGLKLLWQPPPSSKCILGPKHPLVWHRDVAFQVTGRKEDWEKWEKSVVSLFLVCVSVFFASADFIHSSSSSFRSLDTVVSSSPNIKNLSSSFESTPRCPPSYHFVNYFLFGFVIILIFVSFSPLFSFLLPIIRKSITMSHVEGCLDS